MVRNWKVESKKGKIPRPNPFSKVGFQVMTCLKCDNRAEPWPIESGKTPWDVWPKGCPKCGGMNVDVDVIF